MPTPDGKDRYPRPSVAADIVLLAADCAQGEGSLSVLLVERARQPFAGCLALPGGFAQPGETLADTAARELEEETGLSGLHLTELGTTSTPGRDPRGWVISCAYMAALPAGLYAPRAGDDAARAAWFALAITRTLARPDDGSRVESWELSIGQGQAARVSKHTRLDALGCQATWRLEHAGAFAFDHALILARALDALAHPPRGEMPQALFWLPKRFDQSRLLSAARLAGIPQAMAAACLAPWTKPAGEGLLQRALEGPGR
nr:NUDIX hydrolase [bacterium]